MILIGIDGGGTKTDAVLCDETGRVLRRVRGGSTSPTSQTPEVAVARLGQILSALTRDFGGLSLSVEAAYAGLSGGGVGEYPALLHEALRGLLPNCRRLKNHNDALSALRSAIPLGDALVAIAGTGSCVFACVGGELHQVGGWGYLLGDEGSGFDLGVRALKGALREIDGRGERTALTEACRAILKTDVPRAIPRLYAGGRAEIASFAPVLLSAAESGDRVARQELEEAVESLAAQLRAGARLLAPGEHPVALAGSVWNSELYRRMMRERLGDGYSLRRTDLPPVYGCAVIALQQAGLTATPAFEAAFRESLGEAAPCGA